MGQLAGETGGITGKEAVLHDLIFRYVSVWHCRCSRTAGAYCPSPSAVEPVLITVRHAAYNIMRKGNPEPIEDSILNSIPDTSPSPHEIVESREVSRKIKNSLRNLSETDRSIIQLQYGQGYTSTQIAALLDISPNTVRQRAWRTRKMLKAVLEKEGIIL